MNNKILLRAFLLCIFTVSLIVIAIPASVNACHPSLTVATDPTYPPFESINGDTGALQGFDIDLMNEIGKELGVNINFVQMSFWDDLIPGITSGRYDCAISAISITPERLQIIAYSNPYFDFTWNDLNPYKGNPDMFAIAMSQSNTKLKSAIDGALAKIMADGRYRTIYLKWFNEEPPALPLGGPFSIFIKMPGDKTFNSNQALQVKFQLTDSKGAYVTNAVARLFVAQINNGAPGTESMAVSKGNSNIDNLFKYTGSEYQFNLNLKTLGAGLWQLRIALSDGSSKTVVIQIK